MKKAPLEVSEAHIFRYLMDLEAYLVFLTITQIASIIFIVLAVMNSYA